MELSMVNKSFITIAVFIFAVLAVLVFFHGRRKKNSDPEIDDITLAVITATAVAMLGRVRIKRVRRIGETRRMNPFRTFDSSAVTYNKTRNN